MIYYHGSDKYFDNLVLPAVFKYSDFGLGVYLAERESHARSVALWKGGSSAFIYSYKVNISDIKKRYDVKEFRSASIEWLKYVINNRQSNTGNDYDLVIGPTADSRTQSIIQDFIVRNGSPTELDYKRLRDLLMPVDFGIQICIKSQEVLNEFNKSKLKAVQIR